MTTTTDQRDIEALRQAVAEQKSQVKAAIAEKKANAKTFLKFARHLDYIHCSFCDKGQSKVQRTIAGPDSLYICNECVVLCAEILLEEGEHQKKVERIKRFSAALAKRA